MKSNTSQEQKDAERALFPALKAKLYQIGNHDGYGMDINSVEARSIIWELEARGNEHRTLRLTLAGVPRMLTHAAKLAEDAGWPDNTLATRYRDVARQLRELGIDDESEPQP